MKTKTTHFGTILVVFFSLFLSIIGFPPAALSQTYYIQSQGTLPFPFDPYGGAEPVTTLDASRQLYQVQDDTNDWNLLMSAKEMDAARASSFMAMDLPPDPTTDTNTSGDYSGTNSYTPGIVPYSTNDLWLQILSVTNSTANLVIHPPWNVTNGIYDLYYCTNLTSPIDWQWSLRSQPGQTNLVVPNATDAQGFYRLGPPNDMLANDSLGTNFWVAFFNLGNNGIDLSLYISSPVGATGTITLPTVITNGPVLYVTNCGDLGLNGTYVLTNLTPQEQIDWTNNYLDGTDVGYVNGTNWIDFLGTGVWLFAYDSNLDVCTFLYSTTAANFKGNDTNGTNQWYYDTNLPPPTTVCPQVALNPLLGGTYTYTPASSITLASDALYFIVLNVGPPVASGAYEWSYGGANSYNPSDDWSSQGGVWSSSSGAISSWSSIATDFPQFAIGATPVPEPSILGLLCLSGLGLFCRQRKT